MTTLGRIFFCIILALPITGCVSKFCSLNCSAPTERPWINQNAIDRFAKQKVILMPKGDSLRIILPADTFFEGNSAKFKKNTQDTLTETAELLQSYGPTATLEIRGYSDSVSSNQENKELTLARARAVAAYFWSQGLDPDHLYPSGYGSNDLVADVGNVSANAANRRVEILVHAHCTSCF